MAGLVSWIGDGAGSEVRIKPLAQRSPQYGFGEKPDIGEGVMYTPHARGGMYKVASDRDQTPRLNTSLLA